MSTYVLFSKYGGHYYQAEHLSSVCVHGAVQGVGASFVLPDSESPFTVEPEDAPLIRTL